MKRLQFKYIISMYRNIITKPEHCTVTWYIALNIDFCIKRFQPQRVKLEVTTIP